jgi:hypothetical protein
MPSRALVVDVAVPVTVEFPDSGLRRLLSRILIAAVAHLHRRRSYWRSCV